MTDLKDHIVTAVEIAEAAGTAVTMYPNQVRYLLDRITVLEERCKSVEERATTELAIRNTKIDELRTVLIAAIHALQSYAFGNRSTELAKMVVEKLKETLEGIPG